MSMSNATVRGLKCPVCGSSYAADVIAAGGSPGSYFIPGDPPEIVSVEDLNRDCKPGCTATDQQLEELAYEEGTLEFDEDDGDYEPSFDYLDED
jgi:hypothetical protein